MTITYTDIDLDEDIIPEWETVKFTDENILNIKQDSGLLFATTETGLIWVSDDKGKSWRLRIEILEELAREYNDQLRELANNFYKKRQRIMQKTQPVFYGYLGGATTLTEDILTTPNCVTFSTGVTSE